MLRRRTLGIPFPAVKAVNDGFSHERCFCGVRGLGHAFRQRRQLLAGQLPFRVEPVGEPDYFRLLFGRQVLDLFDDFSGGHDCTLLWLCREFKPSVNRKRRQPR